MHVLFPFTFSPGIFKMITGTDADKILVFLLILHCSDYYGNVSSVALCSLNCNPG